MPQPIYLDHNATTPILPEVAEAMRRCWAEPYLNPASQHEFGRRARRVLEDAREQVAELLGARMSGPRPDRVVFTSGGTEANNLAILGLLRRSSPDQQPTNSHKHLIISAIEHPSVTTVAERLSANGWLVDRLGVDANGVIRICDLQKLLRPETQLVVAMLANNVTGVIQPVVELAAICHENDVPLHTDAAQAAGKLPLNFREQGVSTMAVAAHKFGGPLGIGATIVRHDIELSPQILGGFQQSGLRAGTESVSLAVGMRVALECWEAKRSEWLAHLEMLRDEFERALKRSDVIILGSGAGRRLPNTSNVAFVGLDRQALFLAIDQAGVACSTGSACASGSSEPSPVHIAMGLEPAAISGALRFSFGVGTTIDEVRDAARRILAISNDLRHKKDA